MLRSTVLKARETGGIMTERPKSSAGCTTPKASSQEADSVGPAGERRVFNNLEGFLASQAPQHSARSKGRMASLDSSSFEEPAVDRLLQGMAASCSERSRRPAPQNAQALANVRSPGLRR